MKIGYVVLIVALALATFSIILFTDKPEGLNASIDDFTGKAIIEGEKIPIDTQKSFLEFEGYKPTGSHVGKFEDWKGNIYVKDKKITGIEGVAKISSIKTDNEKVDNHLQSEDFFDSKKYPEIKFTSTNINYDRSEVSGILEFHGEKKEITFVADIRDNGISGEFLLDTTPFNFKFSGIDRNVRVNFKLIY